MKYFLLALFNYLLKYRRTKLGPIWIFAAPTVFIIVLGSLYSAITVVPVDVFIPHLAIGIVVWGYLAGIVNVSVINFQKNRSYIIQGSSNIFDVCIVEIINVFINFVHQIVVAILVMVYFEIEFNTYMLVSLLGIVILLFNSFWVSIVLGILGVRYRDLAELTNVVMRIAFLATPIIWIPSVMSRGRIIDAFLTYNPFYYFIEIVRAPLLGDSLPLKFWIVVLVMSCLGSALAYVMYRKYARFVPIWM